MGNIDIRILDCGIRVVMEELDHVKSAAVGKIGRASCRERV